MVEFSALRGPARFALAVLPYSLFLYCLAILTSMAGMEIFSWLSVVLILVILSVQWDRRVTVDGNTWLFVDAILFGFLAIVMLGALMADQESVGFVTIVGRVRWIIIYLLVRTGLRWVWTPNYQAIHLFLIGFMGLTGAYAIVQHFTGIDLVRDSNRAVVPLTYAADLLTPLSWRAAGLYSSSMTYGHSAALAVGFPLALLITGAVTGPRLKWFLTICGALVFTGILASYTRGAWLAAAACLLTVGAFAGRKVLISLALAGVLLVGGAYAILPDFRARVASFVDPKNVSNQERVNIWLANLEMVKDRPVVGVGYGENERLIGSYYEKMGIEGMEGHAHNNFLQVLSGTGILGALLFIAIGLYFLFINWRVWQMLPVERRWERGLVLGIFGAQIAMHVGGLTECTFKDAEINHHYIFLLAVVSMLYLNVKSEHGNMVVRPANESRPLNGI